MDLFIAGLPNSGTTYVAHVLKAAGCDFGDDVWPHSLHRKGMEWGPVRDWYLRMFDVFLGSADPSPAVFDMDWHVRRQYWEEYPPPENPPPFLKVPDFDIHRLDVYYRPEHVLRVVRPKGEWVASMTKWRPGCSGQETLLSEVYDYVLSDLGADSEIEWPRCVRDPSYLADAVSEWASKGRVLEAHAEVTRPEWVTFGEAS